MKTKDIAAMYGLDRTGFEHFLIQSNLRYKTGLLSGMTVDDADAEAYARYYRNRLQAEEAANKRAEEAVPAQEEAGRADTERAAAKAEEEAQKQRILPARAEDNGTERNETEALAKDPNSPNDAEAPENERSANTMANCVKLYREKLKGNWEVCGAVTANTDILATWVKGFSYPGTDGAEQRASTGGVNKNFVFSVYVTGNETGKCMLLVKGNPNGFCSTFGELCFTEDGGFATVDCGDSHFLLQRI